MSNWVMNKLFNTTSFYQHAWWQFTLSKHLSTTGAQAQMAKDLQQREAARTVLFDRELLERSTEDVLDRALLRAHHAKLSGAIPAAEYHKVAAKVESLRKLRFTDDYERLQDKTTYEWMKYKVAAEVGGPQEKAAFQLFEKTKIEEKGEEKYRLFAQSAVNDPVVSFLKL